MPIEFFYSALHWAKKAAKSAEAAADSATQASESSGKIIQAGFDGTLANGVLTFKHAPGGVEVPYNLQDDFEYELDLAFASTANLPTNTQMVIKNGNDTIRFVSALHRDATTNATVADMDAVMRYSSSTGYRWLFKAAYKVTSGGDKVFLLYPVIAKEDTTKITNCITEISQDIKLELNNGTLTLKAGSKVYVPNGAGKFDEVTVPSDVVFHSGTIGTNTNSFMICCNLTGGYGIRATPEYFVSGATAPSDTTKIWYDTTNNMIKAYENGSWVRKYSLPIGIYYRENGNAISIKQVFNGFGYIGSTVFALPGVKGLISNGRNADGTLKNIEFVIDKVKTNTNTSSNDDQWIFYDGYNLQDRAINNIRYYDENENKWFITNGYYSYCLLFTIKRTNGVITSFTPKLPFHAVDYNDFAPVKDAIPTKQDIATAINYDNITNCITEIPQDIKLEINNGTLTLKAGSKVYVPNGAGVFNKITVSADCSAGPGASVTGQFMIFDNGNFSGQSLRIADKCESSATAPTDTSVCWYDTANNAIKVYQNGEWNGQRTLPLGLVTFSSGVATSIDQVFNGFGYIGSTVFALPGVKGLKPNGRNADGSLRNIEFVTSSVLTTTDVSGATGGLEYYLNNLGIYRANFGTYTYNETDNIIIDSSGNKQSSMLIDSSAYRESGKVTSFTPKTTFHAVDYYDFKRLDDEAVKYSDKAEVVGWGMPDYSAEVSISFPHTTSYDCLLVCDYYYTNGVFNVLGDSKKLIGGGSNGAIVQENSISQSVIVPKGTELTISYSSASSSIVNAKIYPLKGVN